MPGPGDMQAYKQLGRDCIYMGQGMPGADIWPRNRVHRAARLQHLNRKKFPTVVLLPEIFPLLGLWGTIQENGKF